jgi:hypothetical protein
MGSCMHENTTPLSVADAIGALLADPLRNETNQILINLLRKRLIEPGLCIECGRPLFRARRDG